MISTFLTYSDCPYYSWIRKVKKVSGYEIMNYPWTKCLCSKRVISMRKEERAGIQCNFVSLDSCDREGLTLIFGSDILVF